MRPLAPLTLTALSTLALPVAAADPELTAVHTAAAAPTAPDGFGARVGGWGFHRDSGGELSDFKRCRMDGLGVFADHTLRGALFVEGGVDLYFTNSFPMTPAAGELPLDRASVTLTAAIGARAPLTRWLRGYVQLGLGVEGTHLRVPYGDGSIKIQDTKALPEGFLGLGADIEVASHTYLGANLRVLVMGGFDYDPRKLQMSGNWPVPPPADVVFAVTPALGAQGQFYVRRDL
jgi:hypothetical protein